MDIIDWSWNHWMPIKTIYFFEERRSSYSGSQVNNSLEENPFSELNFSFYSKDLRYGT